MHPSCDASFYKQNTNTGEGGGDSMYGDVETCLERQRKEQEQEGQNQEE